MPTLNVEGATLADGTEQTLATITANKYLQFAINTTPMQAGDTLKVRWYMKIKSDGTLARFQLETYSDDQTVEPLSPVKSSGPFWVATEARLTIEQTAGTNRTYQWEILES